MDRGALKLKGISVEYGSIEESFMLQVLEHEKKIRYYENMLVVLSAMNVDRDKFVEFMEDYTKLLWPEADEERKSFAERAAASFARFSGKPFMVRPDGEERGTLLPEEEKP